LGLPDSIKSTHNVVEPLEQPMRAIRIVAVGFAVVASATCHSETASNLWKAFATKNKVIRWVGRESLVANPYKYADKAVAFQAWFVGSLSESEAIFSDRSGALYQSLSVRNVPSASLKKGDAVVVAVRVLGPNQPPDDMTNLALVGIYRCANREMACADFAKFNNSGELLLPARKPLNILIQGRVADDQKAVAVGSPKGRQ
jgi:hypothetical protein